MGRSGFDPAAVARTTGEARRGRSLVEGFIARYPALLPAITRAVLRVPDGRLRRALLRYAWQRGYAAFNRGDWEMNTLAFDRERYELVNTDPTRDMIGMANSVGVAGYVETMEGWRDGWDLIRVSLAPGSDVLEPKPGTLVTIDRWQGHLEASGMTLDTDLVSVFEFVRGSVVRQRLYWDVDAALAEHGLRPDETGHRPPAHRGTRKLS